MKTLKSDCCRILFYFAYGSNMSYKRLDDRKINYDIIGTAILLNYKLIFNKKSKKNSEIGFANIINFNGGRVEGILYRISKEDLLKLDVFEGYPEHYRRDYLKVYVLDCDSDVYAITYIANDRWISESAKPTKEYLSCLLEAKDYLSEDYYNYISSFLK